MEDRLIELLETFGYPVYRQGSVTDYPQHFFTFWNNNSTDHAHYDNDNYGSDWDYNVNFFSVDPALLYSVLSDVRTLLKNHDWVVTSKGFDVRSDEETHTGRGINILYLEV